MFKPNTLSYSDGYKPGHKPMLAPNTVRLYGTWIPRSVKHAPKGIAKIVSIGQRLTARWLNDEFEENFFSQPKNVATKFGQDIAKYIMLPYDASHFEALHDLGYLPIRIKALPEGIETKPGIPHMTFINTVDGFAWLTLYLETVLSSLSWKCPTSATIALQYRRNLVKWVMKTDPANAWLIDYLAHDFSARGLDPFSMLSSGLGHASSFRGSDSLIVIPGARYFYGESEDEVCINSVMASEHSVTCTGIFYYEMNLKAGNLDKEIEWYYSFKDVPSEGSVENPDYLAIAECLNLRDWLLKFPEGILSVVSDTFDLWKLITFILPRLKEYIMARNGKLVIRPDSGDPVDIICGLNTKPNSYFVGRDNKYYTQTYNDAYKTYEEDKEVSESEVKGVIELLHDIFGGTVNEQGYINLDPHVGAIYGDSITLDRQVQIYERLAAKGFATTNIVLGVGSFTYQFNTRDTLGFAAKGAWFETRENGVARGYDIFKDPITDDGTKKSLKGRVSVHQDEDGEYYVREQCTEQEETEGLLEIIFEDGQHYNPITLTEIRERIKSIS